MPSHITTAYDLSDATWEIVTMLTITFLLGWFFRYLWSMRGIELPEETQSAHETRPEQFARYTHGDLQLVEGIGPKIESLLKQNGILDWSMLARTSSEQLRTILQSGGERFQMHDPSSWPDQAALALENRWNELVEYQRLLTGGR